MMIVRFRSSEDHEDLLRKVKKMKKFTEEIEDCLESADYDDEPEYRGGNYRKHDHEEDDYEMKGRYSYRGGMR